MTNSNKDVLEQNVSELIEKGGEAPKLDAAARTRIRDGLVAKYAVAAGEPAPVKSRRPLFAIGLGFVATAAIAVVATHFVHPTETATRTATVQKLADGTTYIAEAGTEVTVLGPRKVRISGTALLDVAPGKGVFVVETKHGRIDVLGTRFVVQGLADKTTAAVVRGEVKLASSDGEVVLHAGEQAVAEPGRPPVRGPAPRLSHLVSWAQQARHAEEHDLASHHGTLFARDPGVRSHPPWGQEYPLPIAKLGLDITVEDQVARVALDQTFHNDAPQDLEGMYRFAIPPDAALQRLAMYVDGKLTESAVVERMRARRIYEELVYRRVDPALLEWAGVGRLSLRVYPLKAQEDKRLMLAYTQSLPKLYDDYTITVPLPDVDQTVGQMDIAVRLKGCANCEVQSTSHTVTTERKGDDALVTYHHANEKLGDSFVLHVRDTRHRAVVATADAAGEKFVLVRSPVALRGDGDSKRPAYKPRTWLILDDVSASRSPAELHAQRNVIEAMVGELDENDQVGVLAFDVQARQKLALTRVMDVDRKALRHSLEHEGGVGATDFEVALAAATKQLAGVDPDSAMIVYLGDGMITSGDRHLDALRAELAGKAHFVGVGIGDGPDTQTLGALAAATGGYSTTMDLADDLGWRAFDLVAALHTTRVTGLEAKLVDAQGALVPATAYLNAPQLADGEELELVAKLASDHPATAVELTGTVDGAPWQQRIALAGARPQAGYLPRLWAQRHIAARLLAKQEPVAMTPCVQTRSGTPCPSESEAREARDEVIRREVVALGKKYFLLSRHTSLLVLENDDMYRQYDVPKGAGDTWAPYVLPATIPVVHTVQPTLHLALDAEVARAPLQIFTSYDYPQETWTRRAWAGPMTAHSALRSIDALPPDEDRGGETTRGTMALDEGKLGKQDADAAFVVTAALQQGGGTLDNEQADAQKAATDEKFVVTGADDSTIYGGLGGDLNGEVAGGFGFGQGRGGFGVGYGTIGHGSGVGGGWRYKQQAATSLLHLNYPADPTFDDLTGFIPGLALETADTLRRSFGTPATHTISDAARALLADSRKRLPTGVYRWGDRELAVDDARRLGWRRTTTQGLAETASYDGATWTRRYAELGLDVVRPVASDDIALGLAYLPIWIADPAHYAQYFDVSASGRIVTLSTTVHGKSTPAYTLTFDDQSRLISIADGTGHRIVEIAWGPQGPMAAKLDGEPLAVGFTRQAIADATAWAHGGALPGVVAEQPGHSVDYWTKQVAAETAGSVGWRRAERQLLVAAAAQRNKPLSFATFEALRTRGGVELGDLVLASGGFATASDAQLANSLESFPRSGVAQYVTAARGYVKQSNRPQPAATSREGLVGALSQLRLAEAQLQARDAAGAAATVEAMAPAASDLRFAAAMAGMYQYDQPVEPLLRIWDANAIGSMKNVARAQAAQLLANRGKIDLAADRAIALVDDLDLDAAPPQLQQLHNYMASARQGQVGMNLFYAKLRAKVMPSTSYAHVVAMLPLALQHQDAVPVLARAAELAGDDAGKQVELAQLAMAYGQTVWVQGRIKQMLASTPTRAMYQLAAQVAINSGDLAEGLVDLEAAQDRVDDDRVTMATVRGELAQIISVSQQLAAQTSGTARDKIVQGALAWGERWRAVDPGNTQIDQQLGDLLLAVGDEAGAWRQLSSTIERDPWTGTGYMTVAETFERRGKVADALPFWQQAIVIDQTNPTPLLRKAQALLALGRRGEGDALLRQITQQKWHDVWSGVVYQARDLQQHSR
ncbi:MAG: VIT domain-containing protein [Kofleriaceae bacterium]